MRSKFKFLVVSIICAFFLFVLEPTARADETWNNRMQSMAASITCLAPFVASDVKFNDLKNRLTINSCVDDLARETKSLKEALTNRQSSQSSDALHQLDPLFVLMSVSFADDVETAQGLLSSSSGAYAQHLLRGSLSYCVSCHTRTDEHTTIKFPVFKDVSGDLKLSEQMKLYAATRNFAEALAVFKTAIESPKANMMGPLELERSARLALAIEVRVARDGASGAKHVDEILKVKNLSPEFMTELRRWKTDLLEMANEKSDTLSPAEKLSVAKTLIARAKAPVSSTKGHVAEIDYLRASSLLHSFLESRQSDKSTAEALFGLGSCYEHLESLGFWSANESYYEACIRKWPHSEIALKCLAPLSDSITLGYSGTAGLHIPHNVQVRLHELETLANASTKK